MGPFLIASTNPWIKAAGAMENWGLVTYRTTAVLFDEGKSDSRYKNRIAYVVAHGMSITLEHTDRESINKAL